MVGLQAMVLGRLGCRPHPRASALSCPSPFAGRGSHTSQAGYGAPALYNACIVGRVVLGYWVVLHQRGLRFVTPLRCAGPRVVQPWLLSWGRSSYKAPLGAPTLRCAPP